MSTYAFTIKLASPEAAQRYRALHQAVPAEIQGPGGALETIGLISMEIFHAAPDTLFMLVRGRDGFDPRVGFPLANDLHPAVEAWDDLMHGELLVRVPENDTDLNWYTMDPVYRWTIDQVRQERTEPAQVLLDCTLRDGGFQTNWQFSDALLSGLLPAVRAAGADIAEIGYLTPTATPCDTPLATAARAVTATPVTERPGIAVMAELKSWRAHGKAGFAMMQEQMLSLPVPVTCLRIAMSAFCDDADMDLAKDMAGFIESTGRTATLNLMQVDRMDATALYALACRLQGLHEAATVYLADSFGAMLPGDIERAVGLFRQVLPNAIGFHAHDNLGLAIANCAAAQRAGATWLDGTLGGIGRGAGNAALEHLVMLIDKQADTSRLCAFRDRHITPLRKTAAWGPGAIYAACAQGGVHPSYGQHLLGDSHLDEAGRLAIIAELAAEKAVRFDPALLDTKSRIPA
jgi:4-hydroxy 2-oxovalerate aldolase